VSTEHGGRGKQKREKKVTCDDSNPCTRRERKHTDVTVSKQDKFCLGGEEAKKKKKKVATVRVNKISTKRQPKRLGGGNRDGKRITYPTSFWKGNKVKKDTKLIIFLFWREKGKKKGIQGRERWGVR